MCGATDAQHTVIGKFREMDHGHIFCGECGVSLDEDALDVRDIQLDAYVLEGITSREDYRKLFVETWEIGKEKGEAYTDFGWDDNQQLREGVASHILRAIRKVTPALTSKSSMSAEATVSPRRFSPAHLARTTSLVSTPARWWLSLSGAPGSRAFAARSIPFVSMMRSSMLW
jgi:hypothetical protein